jgi:hypothetical protein
MAMTMNPILEEIHAVRKRLLAEAGGTLDALVDQLQAEERKSNRPRYQTRRTGVSIKKANSGESTVVNQSPPSVD